MKKDELRDFQYTTQSKSEEAVEFFRSIENNVTSLSNSTFLTNLVDAVDYFQGMDLSGPVVQLNIESDSGIWSLVDLVILDLICLR